MIDLLILADAWARVASDPTFNPLCDFNGDAFVDVIDLLTMGDNWARHLE